MYCLLGYPYKIVKFYPKNIDEVLKNFEFPGLRNKTFAQVPWLGNPRVLDLYRISRLFYLMRE